MYTEVDKTSEVLQRTVFTTLRSVLLGMRLLSLAHSSTTSVDKKQSCFFLVIRVEK